MDIKPDYNPIRQDRAKLYQYASGHAFSGKNIKEVFLTIFQERTWGEQGPQESVSGSGSSLEQTQAILKALPGLLHQYDVHTILDIPCGDFHWLKQFNWTHCTYTGADIVEELIVHNTRQYAGGNIRFASLDLTKDALPAHDLILCRDCLVHFSFADIAKALKNIKASGSGYLLTTTFPEQTVNEEILTGGWRPLNLEKAPFCFPAAKVMINEKCTEMQGAFRDKSLALWKISDL